MHTRPVNMESFKLLLESCSTSKKMFSTASLKASTQQPNDPVASRTLLQSYAALPARTRLALSLGVCGIAAAGLVMSDVLEEKYPANDSSQK